ncbi:MAG: cytochrome P450, partial [Actinomycetota bacterium]
MTEAPNIAQLVANNDLPEVGIFNPFDPVARADPYPLYAQLRREDPVRRSVLGVWIVSRYADVAPVLRDPRFGNDIRKADDLWFLQLPGAQERLERRSKIMLFTDPPDHTRLRALVNKAFTPKVAETLRARIEALVDELLAPALEKGALDVIGDLGFPLPVTIIAEMLGVPLSDREMFRAWSQRLARTLDPFMSPEVYQEVEASATELEAYWRALIAERRARPRDDLLTALIAAEDEGDRLSEEELMSMVTLILIAGHETTMNLIGNGLLALMRQPDALAELQHDPGLAEGAIEELLRYDGTVQLTGRTLLDDAEVGGVQFRKGEFCVLLLGGANRDPDRFDDPERLHLARPDNRHLAFGGGAHYCL